MTTNHPAHGPVSLHRLHQIREILSKAVAQSDGGNLGYVMADAVKVIDVAIAARNAEPVAIVQPSDYVTAAELVGEEQTRKAVHELYEGALRIGDKLYRHPQEWQSKQMSCPKCNDTGMADSGGVQPWGEPILIECDCRAAMLQAGNFREIPDSSTNNCREISEMSTNSPALSPIDHGYRPDCECSGCIATARICEELAVSYPAVPDCWCRTCRPVTFTDSRFVVCPECGNKRCPHANDHRNACTGSNEPGQEGSAYPAAPRQEVKQALEHGMQRYAGAMQKLSEGDK